MAIQMDQSYNDVVFNGAVIFSGEVDFPDASISDIHIATSPPISANKLEHNNHHIYSQTGTASAETKIIFVAITSGTVNKIRVGLGTACSNAGPDDRTVTFDLLKNGATVLSNTIQRNKTHTGAWSSVEGVFAGGAAAYVAGDVFEIAVTVGGSTGALGTKPFAVVRTENQP